MPKLNLTRLKSAIEFQEQQNLTDLLDSINGAEPSLMRYIVSSQHKLSVDQAREQRQVLKEHKTSFADPCRIGAQSGKNTYYKNFKKKDNFGRKKHMAS